MITYNKITSIQLSGSSLAAHIWKKKMLAGKQVLISTEYRTIYWISVCIKKHPITISGSRSAANPSSRYRIDMSVQRKYVQIIITFMTYSSYYQAYILIKYKQSTTNMEKKQPWEERIRIKKCPFAGINTHPYRWKFLLLLNLQ